MKISRRELMVGIVGAVIGGGVAATTGLSYYFVRSTAKLDRAKQSVSSDEWILTEDDVVTRRH